MDRSVPVSIIITIMAQLLIGLWWASKLDARVERLEEARAQQRDRDAAQDQAARDTLLMLRADIQALGMKIDRAIERQQDTSNGMSSSKKDR